MKGDGGYRSNTREKIADMLERAGIEGLQKENLAKAAKFSETFEDRQLVERLEQHHVSWRSAAMLCSTHIDPHRDDLIDGVIKGKIAAKDLGRIIKQKAGTKAISGTRSIETAAERAKADILMLAKIAFGRGITEDSRTAAEAALIDLRNLTTKILVDRRSSIRR